MATMKYYLDKRSPTTGGKCHIKISLCHRGTSALYSTDVFVHPDYWYPGDKEMDPCVKKSYSGYKALNSRIAAVYANLEEELSDLTKRRMLGSFKTAAQLRKYMSDKLNRKGDIDLITFFEGCLTRYTNPGTRSLYRQTLDKIMSFAGDSPVRFEQLNVRWLADFEQSMSHMAINGRGVHLRNLRHIIYLAIDEEVTDILNPFRKFRIEQDETLKRSLAIADIRKLRDYPCESWQKIYIDMFMLIFYLQGINIVDLCYLTRENINGDRIEYIRRKTKRKYSIKIEPEAREIIDRYRGKRYLLNIMDQYKSYVNFRRLLNENLRIIGPTKTLRYNVKERSPLFPKISTYYARHSYATIAANLDIPKDTIARALGHGPKTVTDIYINYDNKKLDEAHRKILDAIK